MHMADALISPVVGGAMWATTAGVSAYSIRKVKNDLDEKKIPMMGVMGAFVFAAQMINFTIPATGSSGHIGGGLLLAIILGPYAGFITISSILAIQALFFADGGILALGCNIFNLGFYTCFLAYGLIYKKIVNNGYTKGKILTASIISSVIGLQLGSFSVVLQTFFSGKTELPFTTFLMLMQPIHLVIGIVEGLVTASVVLFVWKVRPEIIQENGSIMAARKYSFKNLLIIFIVVTIILGGFLSLFASSYPDGLEWSMYKVSGKEEIEGTDRAHKLLSDFQSKLAILPDYAFKEAVNTTSQDENTWSENSQTSVSGLVGGFFTLLLIIILGFIINLFKKKNKKVNIVS